VAKQEVTVPDIGGAEGAEVIELLVSVGDTVEKEQGLIVLESDKASMEIPSSHAGTVVELRVALGDELAEGAPILVLDTGEAEAPAATSADSGEPTDAAAAADTAAGANTAAAAKKPSAAEATPAAGAAAAPEPAASGAAAEGPGAGGELLVAVPDIGTDEAVDLIEISVSVGDSVAEGDSLVVLESDKASMEVPSPAAGEVLEILVAEGASVRQGDDLLKLKTRGGVAAAPATPATRAQAGPAPAPAPAPERAAATATGEVSRAPATGDAPRAPRPAAAPARSTSGGAIHAGPAVRKLARELGVDLQQVRGSGPRERLLKEDVQDYVKRTLAGKPQGATAGSGIPAVPEVDFAAFGAVEVVARSKLDKLTAANMQRSWLNVPHVTQFDEADVTELEAFRAGLKGEAERRGTRLTPLPFLLKACAVALRDNPKFNASLSADGESLVYKQYTHIGMAVDTPAGLVVPVIRDVDQKTLWQLAEEVLDIAARARDRKLKPAELQGGCFTISSLGGIGGTGFTPIVNAPEVGILGVSRSEVKPRWDGSSFQPRTMLPLALSYDHRVINGGDAGRFCTQLVGLLGDIRKLLL
jgi:pyruvate dehydrogenase E2 component (dihydrolipoyllysine-residue acetyltransferase)